MIFVFEISKVNYAKMVEKLTGMKVRLVCNKNYIA